MNKRQFLTAIALTAGLLFYSCEKEKTYPKPTIDLTELGYQNSKIGYAGSDLHIEADIVAEARIDRVTIEIHPEGDHGKSGVIILHDNEWEVDTTYTKFSGLKNTTFHEHIDIPVYVEVGFYHFHLIVTDMDGQQTVIEEEIEIKQPNDDVPPVINISSAPTNNEVFNNGQTITISGSVSDDKALGGMYIGLVREDQNLTDAQVNSSNTITLLHTHTFDTHTLHNFSASIVVGAQYDNNIVPKEIIGDIAWQTSNYYIVVKCKDAFGANWTYSAHYPIQINY